MRLRKKRSNSEDNLAKVLDVSDLPSFPAVVVQTLELLRDPDSSASTIADSLSIDPGLTVKLLKLVNSAAFSPGRPINSVEHAVAIAGFGAVETLVLSVAVSRALPAGQSPGFDNSRYWRTASRRAALARTFAGELHPASTSLSFTGGLLQDMAVPLLAASRPDYGPVLERWHAGEGALHELEHEAFGWTHCKVGAWLCELWELPKALSDAVEGHHLAIEAEVPTSVRLAGLVREVDPPSSRDLILEQAEGLGLDPARAAELIDRADEDSTELASLFT